MKEILENNDNEESLKKLYPKKDQDLFIDEGTLLVCDYTDLDLDNKSEDQIESLLKSSTRDNAQILINKIWDLPTKCVEEVIVAELPKPTYVLPRARAIPKPKPLTKWQQFAKAKGLRTKKKGTSKMKWDDILQKWTPTYGFRRAEAEKQKEWLIECNNEGKPITDPFEEAKKSKKERVAKNEFQKLRNIAKARNIKLPKVGLPSTEHFKDAKQLATGARVAEITTASLGKFTEKIKKPTLQTLKGGKVKKKRKTGQLKDVKATTKPKAGKGNRNFRTKSRGRKRR